MRQLGSTLKRLVAVMADNYNLEFTFLFTKLDIADGFWHLMVSHLQSRNFCYVLPTTDGHNTELVVPTALQMVWCESPPFFCAGSETARDIISDLVKEKKHSPGTSLKRL